jgi:hypothetical protein
VAMRWMMSTQPAGSADVSSCRPVGEAGETDCLRSRHSPQLRASRAAAATAMRVAPSRQVPGEARRSQARSWASAKSRRTECGALSYETAAMGWLLLTRPCGLGPGQTLSKTILSRIKPATPLSSSPNLSLRSHPPQSLSRTSQTRQLADITGRRSSSSARALHDEGAFLLSFGRGNSKGRCRHRLQSTSIERRLHRSYNVCLQLLIFQPRLGHAPRLRAVGDLTFLIAL